MSSISEMISRLAPYRKRLATLVLVVGAVVVGLQFEGLRPRTLTIHYDLGPNSGVVREIRLAYVPAGAVSVRGTTLRYPADRYPAGAPRRFSQEVELGPGRYSIEAVVMGEGFANEYSRSLVVPTEGEPRIDLFDRAFASRVPDAPTVVAGWLPTPP